MDKEHVYIIIARKGREGISLFQTPGDVVALEHYRGHAKDFPGGCTYMACMSRLYLLRPLCNFSVGTDQKKLMLNLICKN